MQCLPGAFASPCNVLGPGDAILVPRGAEIGPRSWGSEAEVSLDAVKR